MIDNAGLLQVAIDNVGQLQVAIDNVGLLQMAIDNAGLLQVANTDVHVTSRDCDREAAANIVVHLRADVAVTCTEIGFH